MGVNENKVLIELEFVLSQASALSIPVKEIEKIVLSVYSSEDCLYCNGTGKDYSYAGKCPECHGSGKIKVVIKNKKIKTLRA
jgi:hypothetical protein